MFAALHQVVGALAQFASLALRVFFAFFRFLRQEFARFFAGLGREQNSYQRANSQTHQEVTDLRTRVISSMNAGIIYGYAGLVDGIVSRIKEALGNHKARVIATGGLACLIASETKAIDAVDDYLTLKGLKIIYERNRPRREERVK